jgi:hypothetical protein
MQPFQRLETMVITLPIRKQDSETDGCRALSTIPPEIAKDNLSIHTHRGVNSGCFIATESWVCPENHPQLAVPGGNFRSTGGAGHNLITNSKSLGHRLNSRLRPGDYFDLMTNSVILA